MWERFHELRGWRRIVPRLSEAIAFGGVCFEALPAMFVSLFGEGGRDTCIHVRMSVYSSKFEDLTGRSNGRLLRSSSASSKPRRLHGQATQPQRRCIGRFL